MAIKDVLRAMGRRKVFTDEEKTETKLKRTLGLLDLTSIGVGSTLGAGVYVLSGQVGREQSGPAVILSFAIAAFSSILSGMCYAEFGARVPKSGSGYIYSYVTMGEFCALTIGWNLVLSYVVGTASVAKAWSTNLDALIGCQIRSFTVQYMPFIGSNLTEMYPDIFAAVIILLLCCLLAYGVEEVAFINKLFTMVNIIVIIFVTLAGFFVGGDRPFFENWTLNQTQVTDMVASQFSDNSTAAVSCRDINHTNHHAWEASNGFSLIESYEGTNISINVDQEYNASALEETGWPGAGGFLPYGFQGVISGTATCFYAFVGFDAIATTGEEAINPQRDIPYSIVLSLIVCCLAYLGVSASLTLMVPYFFLDKEAPLPSAFARNGLHWAKYLTGIGATCALTTSLLGAMFPMPRVIYAMAEDGILFRKLAQVSEKTKTPVIATAVSGALAAFLALIFKLDELVDFMSIGTLMAYTLVATSVMVLRYRVDSSADPVIDTSAESFSLMDFVKPRYKTPTDLSATSVAYSTSIIALVSILFSIASLFGSVKGMIICAVLLVVFSISIWLQPESKAFLNFKVPLIPFVPVVNVLVNVYLMVFLPWGIWVKLIFWLAAGYAIYFGYGWQHSSENPEYKKNLSGKSVEEMALVNGNGEAKENRTEAVLVSSESEKQ